MSESNLEELGGSDTARMIVRPSDYCVEGPSLPLEHRGPLSCLGWSVLVGLLNAALLLLHVVLVGVVFGVVLLPTIVVVYFGFQCHSRVLHSSAPYCRRLLDDGSSSALIILGFVILSPLLVVAMVIYCGLARRLRLFLLFQPCARARYRGGTWSGFQVPCCCCWGGGSSVKAWV